MLLQDPNSHILDLLKDGDQVSNKQYRDHFFRKIGKSDGAKPFDKSIKRIVGLKPSPGRFDGEGGSSHFSIRHIRRRLRNAIDESKKKRNLIAMDGILHRIPYGSMNSHENNKTWSSTRLTSKLAAFLKRGDTTTKRKQKRPQRMVNYGSTIARPLYREFVFYDEVNKRLVEMLSSDGRHVSKPSPIFSHGRDKEVDSPCLMRSPSLLQKTKQDNSTSNSSCPCTLDGVVRKDLECGTWMNVRLETEGVVFEIEEVILDYILEETILELWEGLQELS